MYDVTRIYGIVVHLKSKVDSLSALWMPDAETTYFQDSILLWQRRCEDALYSLLVIGARRPIRHLASVAMAKIISKGDGISIYSRASSLQGFLSDVKRSEPQRVAGLSNQRIPELLDSY